MSSIVDCNVVREVKITMARTEKEIMATTMMLWCVLLLLLVDVAVMDLDPSALSVAKVIVVLSDNIPVFGNGASANEERDNGTVQQSSTHEQLMHSLARSYTLANRVRRGVVSRGRKSSRKDEAVLLSCDIIGARYRLKSDTRSRLGLLLVQCTVDRGERGNT
jgi:hypothetical protein